MDWVIEKNYEGKKPTKEYIEIPPHYKVVEESVPHAIHHVDKNPSNNDIKNLRVVCVECHKSYHKKKVENS